MGKKRTAEPVIVNQALPDAPLTEDQLTMGAAYLALLNTNSVGRSMIKPFENGNREQRKLTGTEQLAYDTIIKAGRRMTKDEILEVLEADPETTPGESTLKGALASLTKSGILSSKRPDGYGLPSWQ